MAVKFKDTININGQYTLPAEDGTVDQVMSTDGAGIISFVDLPDGEAIKIACKNTTASTITKGTPVYVTGTVGTSFKVQIAPADASDSAKMPAVGLLETDLAANGEGFIVTGGLLKNLTTDPIDGTNTTSNDTIYVKAGGGLTMTKPTGTNLIQNIGKVGRVNTSNAGSIVVSSILRTNDIPNLTEGKIWVGSANNTEESTVVHIDETNTRIGINQNTPDVTLDITGTDAIQIPKGTDAQRPTPESGMFRFNTTSSEFEGYNGTEWGAIGGSEVASVDVDSFTGNGTTVAYTLTSEIPDEKTTQVYIDGVYQSKGNYSVSGTTLTFSTAPPNGTAIEVVHFTAIAESTLNGSGTANYVTKWQDADTLANSVIVDNGLTVTIGNDTVVNGDLTVDTNTLYVDSADNRVGIGTTSPSAALHIVSTNQLVHNYAGASQPLVWGQYNSSGDASINNQQNAALTFGTDNTARMRIDSSGVVRVGTITAQTNAAFSARRNGANIEFGHSNNTAGYYGTLGSWGGNGSPYIGFSCDNDDTLNTFTTRGFAGNIITGDTGGNLIFSQVTNVNASSQTPTERMRIDSSGNVLVGTQTLGTGLSSFAQMEVSGTQGGIIINSATSNISRLIFTNNNTDGSEGVIRYDGSNQSMQFWTNVNERMRITSAGAVLFGKTTIGVTTQGFRVDGPSGNSLVYSSIPNGSNTYHVYETSPNPQYRFYVSGGGTVFATNTTISAISDARLKENIQDLTGGLDAVLSLKPRIYDWKADSGQTGTGVRGFIAQEVEEVFPEYVDEYLTNEVPEDGVPYKSVRQDFIPMLVKAIQEQQEIINDLKARIETL